MIDLSANNRISLVIREKGYSASRFAEEINFNQSNLSKILRGERKVPSELETKILERFQDVNKVWLLTGEGEMLTNNETLSEQTHDTYRIPLLPISAQGGAFNDFVVSVHESECERVISPIKNILQGRKCLLSVLMNEHL